MALKILLADDSMTAQKMGEKILEEAGYEVVAVSNGAAATKKIASEKPDLIILDVEMPVLPMPSADLYWSVDYRDLSDQRVKLGIMMEEAEGKGVKIVGVVPGSPAEKAGLQKDDLLVGIDGVEVKEPFDVSYQVGLKKPGDVGPIVVSRGAETLTLTVTYDVVKHGK